MSDARRLRSTHTWLPALVAGGHVLVFAWFFPHVWTMRNSGIGLFFDYGSRVVRGALPYRDFPAEYPPLAMALFALPRLVAPTLATYFTGWVATLLVADLVALALLHRAARVLGVAPWRPLAAWTVALLAVGPIVIHQFDLVPAVVALAALVAATRGRHATAGALLAAGTLLKAWPLLLAPLIVAWAVRQRAWRPLGRAIAGGMGTAFVALLPWLLVAPGSLRALIGYHTARGLQVESTWASVLLAVGALTGHVARLGFAAGAWNVEGAAAGGLGAASPLLMLLLVGGALALAVRRMPPGAVDLAWLARSGLVVVLAGLLGSKVLSPQYVIWLLPGLALSAAGEGEGAGAAIVGLFVVIGALTHYVFPAHYDALLAGDRTVVLALLLRNVLLLALAALVALRGGNERDRAPTRHQEPRSWPATTP